jgi:hypothetical protein
VAFSFFPLPISTSFSTQRHLLIGHFLNTNPSSRKIQEAKQGLQSFSFPLLWRAVSAPAPTLTLVAEPSLLLHEQETLGHTIALSSSW